MQLTSNPTKSATRGSIIFTVCVLVICIIVSSFSSNLIGKNTPLSLSLFISRLFFWIALVLVYMYCIKKEKQPFLLWEDINYSIGKGIVSVILALLVVFAGSALIRLLALLFGWSMNSKAVIAIFKLNAPLKLFIVITAAYTEEMIFRGYLIPRLQLFFKAKWWPIIISALVFGFGHFKYGTFVNVAGPVFIGLVFGWYYQKYRNLKILIICHFLIDFLALFLAR